MLGLGPGPSTSNCIETEAPTVTVSPPETKSLALMSRCSPASVVDVVEEEEVELVLETVVVDVSVEVEVAVDEVVTCEAVDELDVLGLEVVDASVVDVASPVAWDV